MDRKELSWTERNFYGQKGTFMDTKELFKKKKRFPPQPGFFRFTPQPGFFRFMDRKEHKWTERNFHGQKGTFMDTKELFKKKKSFPLQPGFFRLTPQPGFLRFMDRKELSWTERNFYGQKGTFMDRKELLWTLKGTFMDRMELLWDRKELLWTERNFHGQKGTFMDRKELFMDRKVPPSTWFI